ncbi:MAG: hypothetical protein Q8N91_01635 [Candidatus Omnitrophota bacterium]|nr:hypothetical protein [Candidatus Omnitrophota bacterium]
MLWMKDLYGLLITVALGYVLCVIGKKQEGILKLLGYALGVFILGISLIAGLIKSCTDWCPMGKAWKHGSMSKMCSKMMKNYPDSTKQ